jgi:hypothetical protein
VKARSSILRIAVLAMAVCALALVPAAVAAKGGGGGGKPHGGGGTTSGSGTLNLVVVSSPMNDNLAHHGGQITYTFTQTATASPYVSTACFKGTTQVFSGSAGYFPSYPWPSAQIQTLDTMLWTSGDADCVAKLYSMDGGVKTILATLNFHAYA